MQHQHWLSSRQQRYLRHTDSANIQSYLEQSLQITAVADLHDQVHVRVRLKGALEGDRTSAAVQGAQRVDLSAQPLQQLLPADPATEGAGSMSVTGKQMPSDIQVCRRLLGDNAEGFSGLAQK